jgi:hypothetical protein
MTSTSRLLGASALAASAATACVLACGPFLTEYRTFQTISPAYPGEYARGNVGVVRPRFARRYLVQAYRRFSGQAPLEGLVPRPAAGESSNGSTPLQEWMGLRTTILAASGVPRDYSYLDVNRVIGANYQFIQNCLDDAFVAAVRTGNARMTGFGGAASPEVREWLRAQDAVFANCKGEPLVLPEPAAEGADPLTRADRAYQTAAAYFYAMRYDEAVRRFSAIAADASSQWRPYGRYLAARALVRSGTIPEKPSLEPLLAAQADLRAILADPGASALHASARGLLGFIESHAHPAERLRAVSAALMGSQPVSPREILDYQWLMDRFLGDTTSFSYDTLAERAAVGATSELNDWVVAMQGSGAGAIDRAIAQWKSGRSAPWLVAALWQVPPDHADAPALLQAAGALDRSSPAFATVAFLRVRLLARRGDEAQARAVLATLPTSPQAGFEAETVNLLAAERLMLAASLEEALKNAPRTAVGAYTDSVFLASLPATMGPVFDVDAEVLLSQRLPLKRLLEAATSTSLPPRLRQRVAGAAFVRALLLNRSPDALEAASVLHDLVPSMQADLDRFRSASTPDDRHIAGIFLLLRRPGLHADVQGVEDDQSLAAREPSKTFDHVFRENWWCGLRRKPRQPGMPEPELLSLIYQGDMPSPSYLSNDDRSALDREFAALAGIAVAPTYLAREAVTWAVARPADPDAAEALAHAVEGTRWGCSDPTTSAASRTAFQTLHRLFPKSEWALRTKYWY